MQLVGEISSFVRNEVEAPDVLDTARFYLVGNQSVALPKIAHPLFGVAARNPYRRDRIDLAFFISSLYLFKIKPQLLDHFILRTEVIYVIRAVGNYHGVGLKSAVGKGRGVEVSAADTLNYAVLIQRKRGAVGIRKRIYARIPALRYTVTD